MKFFQVYWSISHSVIDVTPCVLSLKSELRTRFHLLKPDVKDCAMSEQATQKSQHDQQSRTRELCVGQRMLIRKYRPGEDWIPGAIVEKRVHIHTW